MPLTYKAITAALAVIGCGSLVITGELMPVFVLPGLGMLPGYYRYFKGAPPAPRRDVGGMSILIILVMLAEIAFITDDFFTAVAHMTIAFQALKSFDLREPWDQIQVHFMAMLQLIISSELALSIVFGAVFIVFLVVLIVAMVFSHFLKAGTFRRVSFIRPVVVVTVSVFIMTLILFVSFPRFRSGLFGHKLSRGIKSVGFSETVDLGSFGEVLEDPTIVMRVQIKGPELPLYWRGGTLDYFDGVSWRHTIRAWNRIYRRHGRFSLKPADEEGRTVQKVLVEPIDTPVLFGIGEIHALETPGYIIFQDDAGSVYQSEKSFRRTSYTVYSGPEGGAQVAYRNKMLQIPEGMGWMDDIVKGLVGEGMGDLEKAKKIEAWLRSSFAYSLRTSEPPPGMTPLEYFLTRSKKGYCEHFASAMVMMLRTAGVPARMVTGFAGGEDNGFGDYLIIRQSDAHSWVEAGIEGRWLRFDPTPLAPARGSSAGNLFLDSIIMGWDRYVIGFSSEDQAGLFRAFALPSINLPRVGVKARPAIFAALAVLAFALLVRFAPAGGFLKRRRGRVHEASGMYMRFRKKVKAMGGRVGPASTPSEVTAEARRIGMDGECLDAFMKAYLEARFGGGPLEGSMREYFQRLVKQTGRPV